MMPKSKWNGTMSPGRIDPVGEGLDGSGAMVLRGSVAAKFGVFVRILNTLGCRFANIC